MKKLLLILCGVFLAFGVHPQTFNQFPPSGMTYTYNSVTPSASQLGFNRAETNNSGATTFPFVTNTGNSINDVIDFAAGVSANSATGTAQCAFGHTAGKFYTDELVLADGQLTFCSGAPGPFIQFVTFDATANNAILQTYLNDTSDGIAFGTTTSTTTTCGTGLLGLVFNLTVAGPCSFIASSNSEPVTDSYPMVLSTGGGVIGLEFSDNSGFLSSGRTTSVKLLTWTSTGTNQVSATLGDTHSTSVTNIVGGSAANTQANGTPILTGFTATTTSIGGSLLSAGACSSGTVTATGATTAMSVSATPVTYPGDGNVWLAFVSSANTVTVKVCAIVAGTPGASTYNVRVIK